MLAWSSGDAFGIVDLDNKIVGLLPCKDSDYALYPYRVFVCREKQKVVGSRFAEKKEESTLSSLQFNSVQS